MCLFGGLFINYLIGVLFLVNISIWVNFVILRVVKIYDFFNIIILFINLFVFDDCYFYFKM